MGKQSGSARGRILALLAGGIAVSACGSHPAAARLAVAQQPSARPSVIAAAATPTGWRHVADAEYDPADRQDSRVGYSWTARSDVRWVLSCETTKGARPQSIYFMLTSASPPVGTIKTTKNSARTLQCPVGHVATATGVVPLAELAAHNPSHDVMLQLMSVDTMQELTDGSVIYRADAFENRG